MQPPSAEPDASAESSAADSNSKPNIADKEKDAASSDSDSETKTETEFGDSPDWSARGDSKSGGDSKPPAKAA